MSDPKEWHLREEALDRGRLPRNETLFTIGNGYLGTRGAFEEGYPGELRATLVHGVFDDAPMVFTELVNAPDWLPLEVHLGGEPFRLDRGSLIAYERALDLRSALLTRTVRWRSSQGGAVDLHFERFASLSHPHRLAQRVTLTSVDFSGTVDVRASLNGNVHNLGRVHWEWLGQEVSPAARSAWLTCRTIASRIQAALAMRLFSPQRDLDWTAWDARMQPTVVARGELAPGKSLQFEKVVAFFTSRDVADPARAAREELEAIPEPAWETLWQPHRAAWEDEWRACDIRLEGDPETQFAIRFNLYHLLIAGPRTDDRVTIPAKTLSGFGYHGHAFWDTETFMLPFFTYTRPAIARNLLTYRWRTLPGARRKAAAGGWKGAQFAWESAATGDEVTPPWVPHPEDPRRLVRIWTGDIQIHISADIAHAVRQYWDATGDDEFMLHRGAEVVLDSAAFWASRAEWDEARQQFGFSNVIGPDEYHEHVKHNAFTNYAARWHLRFALQLWNWLATHHPQEAERLAQQLDIDGASRERWRRIAESMFLSLDASTRLIEQFEGYFQLENLDMTAYEPRSRSMQAILGIEGVQRTQVAKQPDVLMLLYLMPDEFDPDTLRANYAYYTPRTDLSHGSSLGPAIHAILACRLDRPDEAYQHFIRAARVDLDDLRGNTVDGIHGASAGGVWQALVFGFAGLRVEPSEWSVRPRLPTGWRSLAFRFCHRGHMQDVEVRQPERQVS